MQRNSNKCYQTGNAMYMFIGRPLSWTDDSNPTPVDSLNDEYDAYANSCT